MSEAVTATVLPVMDSFMNHPLSCILCQPFLKSDTNSRLGFDTIRERLLSNSYPTIAAWMLEVESAIYAFESRDQNPLLVITAGELRRLFTKERLKMKVNSASQWTIGCEISASVGQTA
jgi:hypothetical protein